MTEPKIKKPKKTTLYTEVDSRQQQPQPQREKCKKRTIRSMGLVFNESGNPRLSLEVVENDSDVVLCPDCHQEMQQQTKHGSRFDCINEACPIMTVIYDDNGQIKRVLRDATVNKQVISETV